jgi:hypothetical protein
MTENHPITPEAAAAQEEWWDRSLTSAGRSDILKSVGLKLPIRVLWRHMSPDARAAVDHMRPSEFRPEDQAKAATPTERSISSDSSQQLKVENALLRASLFLTARALKSYIDALHFEIDDDGCPMREVIVSPSLRNKAAEALAKANAILKEPERGRTP